MSAETLIDNDNDDIQNLLGKAEEYIIRNVPYKEEATDEEDIGNVEVAEAPKQKQPRFRFFSAHCNRAKVTLERSTFLKLNKEKCVIE